eukprot:Gb_37287 [translate_table: standard]
MENQLLLRDLLEKSKRSTEEHTKMYADNFDSALFRLSPFILLTVRSSRPSDSAFKCHILELLHSYIVYESGRDFIYGLHRRSASNWTYLLSLIPFFPCVILRMLWRSFVTWINKELYGEADRENFRSLENFKSVGVKLRNCDGGISAIDFDIYKFILNIPRFRIDDRLEVLIKNLIAFEISSSMQQKPVTRYVHFMSNLISTGRDVSILKNEDIITNKLGRDVEAFQILNSITKSIECRYFDFIDSIEKGMDIYCQRKWQVLWAQFQMTHCSLPSQAVSFLAAPLLLLMTAL